MKRRYHIHVPGLLYGASVLLVGIVAMNGQNNLLFWVFGVLFAGLVISGIVSGLMMLGVQVRRLDPHHGAVGEPMLVRYVITNRNRFIPIFNIHIEETRRHRSRMKREQEGQYSESEASTRLSSRVRSQGNSKSSTRAGAWYDFMNPTRAWIMHVGPGESVHGEAVFWPRRRGEVQFREVRVWTTFPFGIVKKSVSCLLPQHTLIYPRVYRLRDDLFNLIDAPAPLGMKLSQRAGPGDEYYGMREHRDGDSVRNVAWKRSALLDELVCIDRSMPSPPRLRLVLDLRRATEELSVADEERFTARDLEERAISLAASILRAAERRGYEIGLTVLGMDLPRFAVRRSHWHLGKLMAALAGINLEKPRLQNQTLPALDFERAAMIVVHPDRSEIIPSRDDVIYLTGRQLHDLSHGPVGWPSDELQTNTSERSLGTHQSEAAA